MSGWSIVVLVASILLGLGVSFVLGYCLAEDRHNYPPYVNRADDHTVYKAAYYELLVEHQRLQRAILRRNRHIVALKKKLAWSDGTIKQREGHTTTYSLTVDSNTSGTTVASITPTFTKKVSLEEKQT